MRSETEPDQPLPNEASRLQTKHHGSKRSIKANEPRGACRNPSPPSTGPCRRAVDAPPRPPARPVLLWGLQQLSISLLPLFFHQKLGKPPSHPRRSQRKEAIGWSVGLAGELPQFLSFALRECFLQTGASSPGAAGSTETPAESRETSGGCPEPPNFLQIYCSGSRQGFPGVGIAPGATGEIPRSPRR